MQSLKHSYPMAKEKKTFFLKRWIQALSGWLDRKLFSMESERAGSMGVPLFWSLVVSFAAGMISSVYTLCSGDEDETFFMIVGGIALAIIIAMLASFLIKDLVSFPSTGKKIGRGVYVVVLCAVAAALGLFLSILAMYLIIGAIVLWVLYYVAFKDATVRPRKIRLDNGETLTAERGVCGEYYYTDASGREYEEVNGGFRMKQ